MKRIIGIFMTVLLLMMGTACSTPEPEAQPPTEAPTAESTADQTPDNEGILSLMADGQNVLKNGMSYDYIMTMGDIVTKSHFAFKGNNVRIEGLDAMNPSLMITKGEDLYIINPNDKTGFKMSAEADAGASLTGEVNPEENMDRDTMNILGRDVIDGELCYIIETANVVDGNAMKFWIHEKYGIVMRMESMANEGKILMEIKNLKVGDIPDSEFEIPAGIEMMEMPVLPEVPAQP